MAIRGPRSAGGLVASASALLLATAVACSSQASSPRESSPAEPSLIPPKDMPSGFVFPPIVDPDQAGPPYVRGQTVQVDGVTLVYEGTSRDNGRYVARFQVSGEVPPPLGALYVLPNGPSAQVSRTGDVVTSEPFALASADPSTLFSWQIGSETLVWELGPIEG